MGRPATSHADGASTPVDSEPLGYQALAQRMESVGYWDNFAEFLIWNAENPGALQKALRDGIGQGCADYFTRKAPWSDILEESDLKHP